MEIPLIYLCMIVLCICLLFCECRLYTILVYVFLPLTIFMHMIFVQEHIPTYAHVAMWLKRFIRS